MQIINFIYELARQHKKIKAMYYGKAYEKGAGNHVYPLLWLDDPLLGRSVGPSAFTWTLNVDILGLPTGPANVQATQDEAFTAGLAIIQRIKDTFPAHKTTIEGFTFMSLSDYYDDNAAGYRFTITLTQANPLNICVEYFDPLNTFPAISVLPDFNLDNPEGCAVFNDTSTLPNFEL